MKSIFATVFLIAMFFVFEMPQAHAYDIANPLQVANGFPVASVVASGDSSAVDLVQYSGNCAFLLDVSAPVSGTNPTLDVKVKECATSGGSFTDVTSGAFTQVSGTATVQKLVLNKDKLKRYVKFSRTIGGTASPQYLMSGKILCQKKYN